MLVAALALAAFPAAADAKKPAKDKSPIKAGAAAVDITSPVGTPMFAYTARSYLFSPDPAATANRALQMIADPDLGLYAKSFEPSTGIHTRILARSLVLKKGGTKYALAQADLGGVPYALIQEVAKRIAATGIRAENILISATHTHSAMGNIWPVDNNGYAFVGGDAFDPRTFEQVAQGIAESIIAADKRLTGAKIGVGRAAITDASRNREFDTYLRNTDIPGDAAAQHADSIDPTVTVVRVDDAKGKPMAVWSNFAVHPTSFGDGNSLLSGDNAGVAARITEKALGPGVVNVWTNSAEGDAAPNGDPASVGGQAAEWVRSSAAGAHIAGKRTAAGILAAWRDAGESMVKDTQLGARRTFWQFDGSQHGAEGGRKENVGPFPVLGFGVVEERRPNVVEGVQNMDPEATEPNCAPVDDMAGPGQGEKMPLIGGPGLAPDTFPVSFFRVGELGIVSFPSEITKKMGERIREGLLARANGKLGQIVIAGLTNAYMSYTATPEEYGACTYEGSFTLFGRQMGYAWLAAGARVVDAVLSGGTPPSAAEPPQLAIGTTQSTPARSTPAAGTALQQPAGADRHGRAVFSWNGGDPQVDAPRGKTFVALQRRTGDDWTTVDTDDGYRDTTQRGQGNVWTETFQFETCFPTGSYRFHVTGRAVRSDGAAPSAYTVDSQPFAVAPVPIAASPSTSGGTASVRPLYRDPGDGALVALPRLVRDATVTFTLADGSTVAGSDPDDDGTYTAPAAAEATGVSVRDHCGNTN